MTNNNHPITPPADPGKAMSELSPAARSVLEAAAASACLAEWGPLNDPPCHPSDEEWKVCYLCDKRDLVAAALRAAAKIVAPLSYEDVWTDGRILQYEKDDPIRNKLLSIANELETL